MNVVRGINSGNKGICQNPELASSLENTLAPASWASVWSTAGRRGGGGSFPAHIVVESCQIDIDANFAIDFRYDDHIPEHHSVGSLILDITP